MHVYSSVNSLGVNALLKRHLKFFQFKFEVSLRVSSDLRFRVLYCSNFVSPIARCLIKWLHHALLKRFDICKLAVSEKSTLKSSSSFDSCSNGRRFFLFILNG